MSVCLMVASSSAHGLQIILNDLGGAAPGSLAGDGFNVAADYWESHFNDNTVVSIDVGFSTLNPGVLGQAQSYTQSTSYASIRDALINDVTTSTDQTVADHLMLSDSLSFLSTDSSGHVFFDNNNSNNNRYLNVNRANLKALGLAGASSLPDATITFSDAFGYDFDPSDGVSSSLFDFVGIAIHEIGHALGFVSGVDYIDYYSGSGGGAGAVNSFESFPIYSVLDLFRFSERSLAMAPTAQDLGIGDAAQYFSTDAGQSVIAPFATGRYNGDGTQASHWKNIAGIGILKPTISRGSVGVFTENDLLAFDAIGFDRVTVATPPPVPVPISSTLFLFLVGLLSMNYARKII